MTMIPAKCKKAIALATWLMLLLFYACNNPNSAYRKVEQEHATTNDTTLQTGGVYLIKNKAGNYTVSKILAMDDFAVHVRMYAGEFKTRPRQINTGGLYMMIGHAPMDAAAFLAERPELLTVESVKDAELEGYRIYLEQMKK